MVKATKEQSAEIVRAFVKADIDVYEMSVVKKSLEDRFLRSRSRRWAYDWAYSQ